MEKKKVPNPNGKKGGKEHQDLIAEVSEDIDKRGYTPDPEHLIPLTNKKKKCRYVDVAALDEDDLAIEYHQIGKQNKNGTPVKRERDAIADIEEADGIEVQFHAYNTTNIENNGTTD